MNQKANVIIPYNMNVEPEPHEIEVAWIMANNYNCVVEFLKPINSYKIKTADFVMNGLLWELKSPTGNSKRHTIEDQFSKAKGKKQNLIIDGRRTKLDDVLVMQKIKFELEKHRSIRKLIYITKTSLVLEIK